MTKMSLLEALRSRRAGLQRTRTTVTRPNGTRYIEDGINGATTELTAKKYGFVVDSKPDRTPVKIVEYLYLGAQDAAEVSALKEYNIESVLSVGVPLTNASTYRDMHISCKYLPCLDVPETQLRDVVEAASDFIDAAVAGERNVLVHCNAGVSRSPSIVIAYLMRRRRMTYRDAHAHVLRLRPSVRPNDGFAAQLASLDNTLDTPANH